MTNQGTELQLIRMTDQHGRAVALDVRQDGKQPGLVPPGRRVRFKIRAHVLAYRVEHVVLGDCEHWHVYDVRVGSQSQLSSVGDSPAEDGFPGAVFSPDAVGCFLSFETVQTAMDLVLDVTYRGPAPDGAPFDCSLRCTAAYGDERDAEVANGPRAAGSQLVGRWGSLVPGNQAQLGSGMTPTSRPGCSDEQRQIAQGLLDSLPRLTTVHIRAHTGGLAIPETEQKNQPRRKMMLVSDNPSHSTEAICVTGTRSSIIQAARRMASRTRGCVSISQIVWQYHRAGCEDGSGEPPGSEGVDWTAGEESKAEELRQGIERIASDDDDMTSGQIRRALRDLLDEVDARDSLADLEDRRRASDSPGDVLPQTAITGIGETVDGDLTSRGRERFGITPDVEDAAVATGPASMPRPGILLMPCKHPESKQYVLALDEKANARAIVDSLDGLLDAATNEALTPRHVSSITWCRACGAVQGWNPADDPSDGMWQLPDTCVEFAAAWNARHGE